MWPLTLLAAACLCGPPASARPAAERAMLPPILLVPKPVASGSILRARAQPTVPASYRVVPFVENAPEPKLTGSEQRRGYLLFQRPITEPVHPNTRPLAHERVEALSAFATPGEYEPVTFSVFPVRNLKNFHVSPSDLTGPGGRIGAADLTVRLVTYWNVGFPRYTSRDTYRRLPELLEHVTVHDSPARECQRWWIQIHVPRDTKPGLYRGTVTIWDDGFDRAVAIPLFLRVLGFQLKADPAKHYSTYYYVRNRVQYGDKDEAYVRRATGNEYRAMVDYGLDMLPTFSLSLDDRAKKIVIRDVEELRRMQAVGLRGPLPVTGGSVIDRIYRATTPGGKRERHWQITKMPPPEFYQRVTAMFRTFAEECRAQGGPELVCCPIDEVAASHKEFGWRVYKAVHDAGIRTYATKDPRAADAAPYRPYIDVWCSQPYSEPFEKIIRQQRYEYWCYPNHNAGEIKDRVVMCKGGRMTYGFGFWRSGYTTLIPWHWAWTPAPDQFDYLRGSHSGCGQRIGEDGQVIPAVYWDCFREGRDDARYIYTLEQAIFERLGTTDPNCRRLVTAGQALLQETWNAIVVQQKYLRDGMWPSDEFNARRWRLGQMIESLLEYPATRTVTAPSVLVPDISSKQTEARPSIVEQAVREGKVSARDLGGDFRAWHNETKEGRTEATTNVGQHGQVGLRWWVTVDHESDGGEGGKYPVGWPRVRRTFDKGELDMSTFDYLEFMIRVDSDRDEVSDDTTPLGFTIGSHQQRRLYDTSFDLGGRQRVWVPVRLPIKDIMEAAGAGPEPWKNVSYVQFFISERNFRHGVHLTFDVASVKLLRFTSPLIARLSAPRWILLPRRKLPVLVDVAGMGSVSSGTHQLCGALMDPQGNLCCEKRQDLTPNRALVLDTASLAPGSYTLRMQILTRDAQLCSQSTAAIHALAGPLAEAKPPDTQRSRLGE